jgi:hypothetical protein
VKLPILYGETAKPLLNVAVLPVVTTVLDVDGKVIVVLSVPASVNELLAVNVFPSAIVRVEPVAGAVIVILFIVLDRVTARPSVIPPVAVPLIVTVPVPLASIVIFSFDPDEIAVMAIPPPAAALFMLMPVALDAVLASMLNAGLRCAGQRT